jgi:UDP-N-acetylglucosamine 4,6-dehydratase
MKRIPECESNALLCHEVNVIGSAYVARACNANGVERCVGISTDKACQPVTVYGASKLMMEKIFQAQPADICTFVLARYGNVLESRGSVIPIWRAQVAASQAITVTDRRMTRFWMSPATAAQCVLDTLTLRHGEILVPKIKALPIIDMARFVVGDAYAAMREIGLRSAERLHEWLVSLDEAATEYDSHFIVSAAGEILRHSYTSLDAPRLTHDEFMAMLAEVEES